ncbi:hypothetical protein LINPERPRIM_LOCUS29429 [Linum perenne]
MWEVEEGRDDGCRRKMREENDQVSESAIAGGPTNALNLTWREIRVEFLYKSSIHHLPS